MNTEVNVLFIREPGRIVAHNLDHDLVAVGSSHDEAEARMLACSKSYIEFGIRAGQNDSISRPAPPELLELAQRCQKAAPEHESEASDPDTGERSYAVRRIAPAV